MTFREETDAVIRNSRRVVVLAVAGAVAVAPAISGCGAGDEPQTAAPTQLTEGVNVTVPKNRPAAAQVDLRNMFLLAPEPGRPVPAGSSLALYGVIINQVKGRADRLVGVTSPAFGGPAKIDNDALALPPAQADGTGSFVRLLGKPSATPTPTPQSKKKTRQPGGPQPGATRSGTATPEPTGQGATPNTSETPTSGNTAVPQTSQPAAPAGDQPLVVLPQLGRELLAGATVPLTMRFEKAGSVEFQVPVVPRQGDYTTYPVPPTAAPTQQTPGGGATSPEPPTSTKPGQPGTTESPEASATPSA
jgi:copper(I)-binding protein